MGNKEKFIRKVYGDLYDKCNPDEDGWVLRNYSGDNDISKDFSIIRELVGEPFQYHYIPMKGYSDVKFKFRPRVLENIETNNGWKSIIEDGYPELQYEDYYCIRKYKEAVYVLQYGGEDCFTSEINNFYDVTHWQEIIYPKLPLY